MTTLKRVLILVEGQTEERFVRDVLMPEFTPLGLYFHPTLLKTKRVKDGSDFKGGVTHYAHFKGDLLRLLPSARDGIVTTLLDYYGLPGDFPGMSDRHSLHTPLERVLHVEQAIHDDISQPPNFVPFLALHEFEALLFSSPVELPNVLISPEKAASFSSICSAFATPEDINENPDTAPSKRIKILFPDYKKTLHGPMTVTRIGLAAIRKVCPHLNQWLERLEAWAPKNI
ncbi:MAG: DUF4276 family protein [Opitutaceae bacterium]|jgi:hypothetical protein|nr:DUF4276 family protein [Opitutaceae bacterium]